MTTAALLSPDPQPPQDRRHAADVAEVGAGLVPGSPEWHAVRRSGVGGSDVAAVMNLSPWTSAVEVYLAKLGQMPQQEDRPAMLWGRLLEPLVRQRYADVTGRRVIVPRNTFRSETHPFMIANLDGIANETRSYAPVTARVLEVKTARSAEGWGEPGSSDIPLVYLLQVEHYMRVTGLSVADVAVLIGGNDFRIYEVEADRELQDMIVEAEARFWQRVQDREPPPVVNIEDARLRWGSLVTKGIVQADPEALEAAAMLRDAVQHRKDLEAVEAECKTTLMGKLADRGDTLVDVHGKTLVTWKLAKAPGRFDLELFQADYPDLFAKYSKTGAPSRRFLLKD